MKKVKLGASISNLFLFALLFLSLTFANTGLIANADSGTPTPKTMASGSANIYLPAIRYEPSLTSPTSPPTNPVTYYISPTGSDYQAGTSESTAWQTFNHAWKYLFPGDTLILLDGVYHEMLNPNVRNGQPGMPITIRAKNDGKVIIDGEHVRLPVKLGDTWPGPIGNYFVIEGIIAKNSNGMVYDIKGDHNILRRVSGYNANTDTNSHVFSISSGDYNLIEDCIAAGTGRKMVLVHIGQHNTIRRCFADWRQWDGREWHDCWPWGDGIEIYNASNNTIENSIAYSMNPTWQISLLGSRKRAIVPMATRFSELWQFALA